MIKSVFKWLLRLLVLAVVLAVVFFLSLDSVLRIMIQHNIRAQTGMEAEIGKFHLGLLEPVVEIKNLQLFNSADFGGTPFLNIPEIHVEYDRAALAQSQIHITLLRFNLGELDIVKNAAGQTNLFALGLNVPTQKNLIQGAKINTLGDFKKQTGLDFQGIDVLNVSVGTAKYIDLQDQKNNREQNIGIENQVINHVTTPADLAGLAFLVALRGGDFFGSLVAPPVLK
jgi:predicted membrane metal-binding protein